MTLYKFKVFLRFLFSGGVFSLLDFIIFFALAPLVSHELAYLLAYGQCILLRYFWDSQFTFKTTKISIAQAQRYIIVNSGVLFLGFVNFQINLLFIEPLWAKLASIPLTLLSGFIFTKSWVFKK